MASMREVAKLFKENGIDFTPKNFDAYLRGVSLEELISKEEKKDNHILNALKAYSIMPGDGRLYPFFGHVRGSSDIHEVGNTYNYDGDRGGFSVNGLDNDISAKPSVRRDILSHDMGLRFINRNGKVVIVSGKEGKVKGPVDNDNEHVFSTLTPKDIVYDGKNDYTYIPLSELAEALGDFENVEDAVRTKKFIQFMRSKGLTLEDIDMDFFKVFEEALKNKKKPKKGEFEPGLSNAKSQGRKVVDQLYNRGMDNIVSDEELKNA